VCVCVRVCVCVSHMWWQNQKEENTQAVGPLQTNDDQRATQKSGTLKLPYRIDGKGDR
jgi:hypothetical protein